MALRGKIVVRDGKVYFASGFHLTTVEGGYRTNFWRLDCPVHVVEDGEEAESSDATVRVFKPRGFGVRNSWRICNPDGSWGGGGSLAAFFEETTIPKPKVRAGTEVRWGLNGWEKYSKKERGWIPA